jgi:hypothetical protein
MTEPAGKVLHHVALVHAPGGRPAARTFFELVGCEVFESGGPFLLARIAPADMHRAETWMFASEVTPEQWQLELALSDALREGSLAAVGDGYLNRLRSDPQHACHFAIRMPSEQEFEATVDRIASIDRGAPTLSGRVSLSGVFRPGDPGAQSRTQTQAFVYTDVVASGLLAFGQHIELQWEA